MSQLAIDLATFAELRESTGQDFTTELVETFAEDLPQMLATLRQAHAAGDATTFRRAAHSIKSNASTFGALPLASLARALEQSDMAHARRETLDTLESAGQRAVSTLLELCRG